MVEVTDTVITVATALATAGAAAATVGRNLASKKDLDDLRSELRREFAQQLESRANLLEELIKAAERHAQNNQNQPMAILIEHLDDLVQEMREARRG